MLHMFMQKTYSRFNAKTISGAATLITMLILVTPLCGLLFQCGCNWPWLGLNSGCNFYKSGAEHRCPWCASMIPGLLSAGLFIISGVLTAMAPPLPLVRYRSLNEITVRTLSGLTVFALMAMLTAGSAVMWQNYPIGVGSFLH